MTQNLDYEAHTAICVDLYMPGAPVTTLGMKMIDVHVSDLENVFGLTANWWADESDNIALKEAMKTWGQDFVAPAGSDNTAVVRMNKSNMRVPVAVTSADSSVGDRARRKRFRQVELHGYGTGTFRIYCDGRLVGKQTVTATQTPTWARKMNLPRGTTGHTLRYEATGDMDIVAVVIWFDPLVGVQ